MSTAKVIEVIAEGSSIENAIQNAIEKADESIHSVKSIWVENISALVEGGRIRSYRVNAKLTFVLD